MTRAPDQDTAIAEAIKYGRALGKHDDQAVLAVAYYFQNVGPAYRNNRSIVKIVREMDDFRVKRMQIAAKPFVDLLEPTDDDKPFTEKDFFELDVYMLLMGGGELGFLPLGDFMALRDACQDTL